MSHHPTDFTGDVSDAIRDAIEAVIPDAIVTVGGETFEQASTQAMEKVLNELPQFVPAQTMFSAGDVQPSAFNNPGIVTLNLRGLGANRNLVLLDGRRPQPANASAAMTGARSRHHAMAQH